jgi:hypothetical protein
VAFYPATMFLVSDAAATSIREAFVQDGELWAAIELRRLLPVRNITGFRSCARLTIARSATQ